MEKVDIYLSCIWRNGFEIETVRSLINQPELGSITITLNNYTEEQQDYIYDKLKDGQDVINIFHGNNEKCSNEKLRWIYTGKEKYVCLVDNDIVYPPDFLSKMIHGCEIYQAHVSLHGVVLFPRPIKSYYRDRYVYRGLKAVIGDYQVDISSNCGSLWKREWFDNYENWINLVSNVSADDIYLAVFMKNKGIPRYVLGHTDGYIRHKEQLPGEKYVFDQYALVQGADSFQTNLINTYYGN